MLPRTAAPHVPRSVVAAAADGRPLRLSTKALLLEMSWHLERQAAHLGAPAVVMSAFQTAERFTPATRRRYAGLAEDAAFVGAVGVGIGPGLAGGVRSGHLWPGDPLVDEWAVVVLGPHFAAALAATDLHDTGPEAERRFAYVLTYDRDRVVAAASSLMARITRSP
jgi:DICT domain-containing protein